MKPSLSRNIVVVAFVALASGFGQDLITPVLPAYLALLGVDRAGIGLVDGLLQGATSLFRFVSGVLSDRFRNRKWFVFGGYCLSSVSRPLLAIGSTFASVAFLRTIDGVGKGAKDAPRDALIADSASASVRGRAFGFHRLVDTAGSVFGPLLAAAVLFALSPSLGSYRIIFVLAAIPGAIALVLIALGIREPERKVRAEAAEGAALPRAFWGFTLVMTLAMLTRINDSLFLLRAGDAGIPNAWIPVLFAGFTLVYAALSYPIGIWSDRLGKLPFIMAGWLVLAAVEFGFSFSGIPLAGTVGLFAFYGLSLALTEGSGRAIIADLVPADRRGSAYAVFHTLIGIALIVGGFGLGKISDAVSPSYAFALSSSASVTVFLLLFFVVRKSMPTRAAA